MSDFGYALKCLRDELKVSRSGWNGKGMYLFLVEEGEWNVSVGDWSDLMAPANMERSGFICMKTADSRIVPWLASQTDILAEDWEILV